MRELCEVIVFGGAFDPIHQGHIDCCLSFRDHFPEAKILLLPSAHPAGAKGKHKRPDESFAHRVEMIRLALSGEVSNVEISHLESDAQMPHYTLASLKSLALEYPGKKLALAIGLDQWRSFPNWQNPHEIIAMCDLVVVRRVANESIVKVTDHVASKLQIDFSWDKEQQVAHMANGSRIFILDVKTTNAASSDIKFRLFNHKPLPSGFIDEKVMAYIKQHHLYGQGV